MNYRIVYLSYCQGRSDVPQYAWPRMPPKYASCPNAGLPSPLEPGIVTETDRPPAQRSTGPRKTAGGWRCPVSSG